MKIGDMIKKTEYGQWMKMTIISNHFKHFPNSSPLRFMLSLVYCHAFMISYNLALIHRDKLRTKCRHFSLADLGALDVVYYWNKILSICRYDKKFTLTKGKGENNKYNVSQIYPVLSTEKHRLNRRYLN